MIKVFLPIAAQSGIRRIIFIMLNPGSRGGWWSTPRFGRFTA